MSEREKIEKEIEDLKDSIEIERSFNEHNGTISFLQWQLYCAREELKRIEEGE